MTTKDWYHYILHNNIFYTKVNGTFTKSLCRIERNRPDLVFPEIWTFVRMPTLQSQTTSFLWRLAHELIPSENRLSQCNYGGFTSPFCKKACVGNVNATYTHIFFQCTHSKEVGDWLLNKVQVYSSTDATADSILDFRHLENDALSWITATTLHYIWEKRISTGGRASTGELLIQMKEKMKLMENTKFHNIFVIGSNMMVTA